MQEGFQRRAAATDSEAVETSKMNRFMVQENRGFRGLWLKAPEAKEPQHTRNANDAQGRRSSRVQSEGGAIIHNVKRATHEHQQRVEHNPRFSEAFQPEGKHAKG